MSVGDSWSREKQRQQREEKRMNKKKKKLARNQTKRARRSSIKSRKLDQLGPSPTLPGFDGDNGHKLPDKSFVECSKRKCSNKISLENLSKSVVGNITRAFAKNWICRSCIVQPPPLPWEKDQKKKKKKKMSSNPLINPQINGGLYSSSYANQPSFNRIYRDDLRNLNPHSPNKTKIGHKTRRQIFLKNLEKQKLVEPDSNFRNIHPLQFHSFRNVERNEKGKDNAAMLFMNNSFFRLVENTSGLAMDAIEVLRRYGSFKDGEKVFALAGYTKTGDVADQGVDLIDRSRAMKRVGVSGGQNREMYSDSNLQNQNWLFSGHPRAYADVHNPSFSKTFIDFLKTATFNFVDKEGQLKSICVVTDIDAALSLLRNGLCENKGPSMKVGDYQDGVNKDGNGFPLAFCWGINVENSPKIGNICCMGFGECWEDDVLRLCNSHPCPRIREICRRSFIEFGSVKSFKDHFSRDEVVGVDLSRRTDLGWARRLIKDKPTIIHSLVCMKMILFFNLVKNDDIRDLFLLNLRPLNSGIEEEEEKEGEEEEEEEKVKKKKGDYDSEYKKFDPVLYHNYLRKRKVTKEDSEMLSEVVDFLKKKKHIDIDVFDAPIDDAKLILRLLFNGTLLGLEEEKKLMLSFHKFCSYVRLDDSPTCIRNILTRELIPFRYKFPRLKIWKWERYDFLEVNPVAGDIRRYKSPELCHYTPSDFAGLLNGFVDGHKELGDLFIERMDKVELSLIRYYKEYAPAMKKELIDNNCWLTSTDFGWKKRFNSNSPLRMKRSGEKHSRLGLYLLPHIIWEAHCKYPLYINKEKALKFIHLSKLTNRIQKLLRIRSVPQFRIFVDGGENERTTRGMFHEKTEGHPNTSTHYTLFGIEFIDEFCRSGEIPLMYSASYFEGSHCQRKDDFHSFFSNGNFRNIWEICTVFSWEVHYSKFPLSFQTKLRENAKRDEEMNRQEKTLSAFSIPTFNYCKSFSLGFYWIAEKSDLMFWTGLKAKRIFRRVMSSVFNQYWSQRCLRYPIVEDIVEAFDVSKFSIKVDEKLRNGDPYDKFFGDPKLDCNFYRTSVTEIQKSDFILKVFIPFTRKFLEEISVKMKTHVDDRIEKLKDIKPFKRTKVYENLLQYCNSTEGILRKEKRKRKREVKDKLEIKENVFELLDPVVLPPTKKQKIDNMKN